VIGDLEVDAASNENQMVFNVTIPLTRRHSSSAGFHLKSGIVGPDYECSN
jgi:hypothetical protein